MEFIPQVEPFFTGTESDALQSYLKSGGWLTEFERTEEFGQMLADFLGAKYTVIVTSGTSALYLSMLALGVRPVDSVVVPNYTMIATPNSVKWVGADVILCDIDPDTLCLDLQKVQLKQNTKALIYVPINGRCGNMADVVEFCKANSLFLVEDSCQALGSMYSGRYLGTFGEVGIFSFTLHKIVTTGQGGAVVTNNEDIYKRIKKLKDFHRTSPGIDWHDGLGFNFKFTDLQAVVGIEQMRTIGLRITKKKTIFQRYREKLKGVEQVTFLPTDLEQTTPWFMDIILPSQSVRDELAAYLKKSKIKARPFYPPLTYQQLYSNSKGNHPVSESIACRGLWLPSSIGLSNETVDHICDEVISFFQEDVSGRRRERRDAGAGLGRKFEATAGNIR